MKISIILIIIFTSFNTYAQKYFINAENGLNVRSESSLSSKKLNKIPFGTLVEKTSDTDKYLTINDNGNKVKGKFVKIKYTNEDYFLPEEKNDTGYVIYREGYVFDAFLTKQTNNDLVQIEKIEKSEYFKLLKQANKINSKTKKISDLDSVKIILKNKVEWFSESEMKNAIVNNAIKSITLTNGRKLLFNINVVDFGFLEEYSGYYPEYDILVLEGGHSSNVCFSLETGGTEQSIGNPEYIIPSPKDSYRLNGSFGGQTCISYFFQKKINGKFTYLTEFNTEVESCSFKEFYWINENTFIYRISEFLTENGIKQFYKGKIKNNT
ncbi:SH3 domain-containing protein [Cellulophaga sp. HaHa_2_1]|uniref:SH3 domain-containing protein n=1 Tax=Cellulophaga sp. HaHa_2_1 TaxID=2749994 RepID=UPI001C4FFC67|nr:SH3 domain-containing protein [Cellulophaga sp. HaHa_2_1]QXP54141.1 SH3 domain-containing protein [Cellulophaga sp. HaHa_2_1]